MNRDKKYHVFALIIFVAVVWFAQCLPNQLFNDPISTAIYSQDAQLLNAQIASDGQWRFEKIDSVPYKFEQAILCFEDKRFRSHIGVDVLAIARAMKLNIKSQKVVSGASTITMQLMRMSRNARSRSVWQKIIESIWALRAEFKFSKDDILKLYVSNAPFGGNVVGLEAASWRYYSRSPYDLSWSEAATLAVLPNQPSIIHPGRNRDELLKKRNALLLEMFESEIISKTEYQTSLLEAIPKAPVPLPRLAPHLMAHLKQKQYSNKIVTTIDHYIQERSLAIVNQHYKENLQQDIHNASVLIIENATGKVISYVGNTLAGNHEGSVDMVQAERSSGSILKPLLYASMIDDKQITPDMILPDIPSYIKGYMPLNYHKKFSGALPASEALSRSLNVPAVLMLKDFGIQRFKLKLEQYGISTLHYSADHYGLPLILGGAEVSLWDLCNVYASMSRTLEHHYTYSGKYDYLDWSKSSIIPLEKKPLLDLSFAPTHLSASAIWSTFSAMQNLSRPDEEGRWQQFESSQKIAWKTGTSYGHRDAWAIGCTPLYTIGVWAGNADGEGRPGIVGVSLAGSLMFDILNILPKSKRWFYEPMDEMKPARICSSSGHIANLYCEKVDSTFIPFLSTDTPPCKYHSRVYLDTTFSYQVNTTCATRQNIVSKSWFLLPAQMAQYYRLTHPEYRELPPMLRGCESEVGSKTTPLQLIYPYDDADIYLPIDIDGGRQKTVAKAAHSDDDSVLYWHMDGKYLGSTETFHTMALDANRGPHELVVVDGSGNKVTTHFDILSD